MANSFGPRLLNEIERQTSDKLYETLFHNNRTAAEVGLFCLKAVLILNGAASIALISMHGIVATDEGIGRALTGAGGFFLGGLGAAGIAAGFNYWHLRLGNAAVWDQLLELHKGKTPRSWPYPLAIALNWIAVFLSSLSFALFIYGGYSILIALEKLAESGATGS